MADIRGGLRHNFHVLGIACILVLSGTGLGVNAFADNHATTITLQDLGVLQLVAHDLFDVRRGDTITSESAVDFENGRLDLSTLLVNTTSGNYFDNATIAKGGEVRNRENVVMFTVSSKLGETYLNFTEMGDSQKVAREKTLTIYHEMFAKAYNNTFGEPIPDKLKGPATPDGNIALRTVHDFLPGNITFDNGTVTPLLSIPPNVKLSTAEMMQRSSPLDGELDEEFLAIDISHLGGPMIIVNLLDADQTFGKQFSTKFSFDELLAELADGEYDTNDKALVEIRNLISVAYPETYRETTSLISISSPNVHGLYVAGDVINITATFPKPIRVEIDDDSPPYISLNTTTSARAVYRDLDSTNTTMTFEYNVRNGDYSPDLEYAGRDAFRINSTALQYLNGSSFPTTLPQPGNIGSLSYDKNIRIGLAPPVIKPNVAPSVVSIETGELDTIIMTVSEDVRNSGGTAGFTISGISPAVSISNITLSGRIITLGLSDELDDSDSPRLAYNDSTGGIEDLDGQPLASFDRAVRNTLDTTAPTVRSVTIDNSGTVYVRLSEIVQEGPAGPGTFSTNNTSIEVSRVAVSGSTVTLELSGEIPGDAALTLSYIRGSGMIADGAGNLLDDFDEPINKQSRKRVTVKSMPAVDLASMKSLGYLDSFNGTVAPHDPFAPITPMNAGDVSGFAIAINDMHYLLGGSLNTLELQTLLTGVNNTIIFVVHDHADIAHFTLYMNLHGQDTDYKDSDTYVTYDMGNIRIVDPHNLISNATVSIKTNQADSLRHIVVFVITFEGEMEQTNLVARTWNTDASFAIVRILNAFAVSAALPDPQPVPLVDPMPENPMSDGILGEPEDAEPAAAATPDQNTVEMVIRTWSGFEPGSVTDAQLLDALGLDYDGDIPSWVMTELGVLCAQDRVTIEEFTAAVSYVLANI